MQSTTSDKTRVNTLTQFKIMERKTIMKKTKNVKADFAVGTSTDKHLNMMKTFESCLKMCCCDVKFFNQKKLLVGESMCKITVGK